MAKRAVPIALRLGILESIRKAVGSGHRVTAADVSRGAFARRRRATAYGLCISSAGIDGCFVRAVVGSERSSTRSANAGERITRASARTAITVFARIVGSRDRTVLGLVAVRVERCAWCRVYPPASDRFWNSMLRPFLSVVLLGTGLLLAGAPASACVSTAPLDHCCPDGPSQPCRDPASSVLSAKSVSGVCCDAATPITAGTLAVSADPPPLIDVPGAFARIGFGAPVPPSVTPRWIPSGSALYLSTLRLRL